MRSLRTLRTIVFAGGLWLGATASALAADPAPETLTLDRSQTAGINGQNWDKTYTNALTVDAVNRIVLVRFPGAAEAIKAKLESGLAIERAELILEYTGHELQPLGYISRGGMMEPNLKADPPNWHVTATALRRPWMADAKSGPTYNAYLAGAGYWTRYGAQDPQTDRFPNRFDPVEVTQANPTGKVDVTAAMTDPAFGSEMGRRLRAFEEQGFLLRKLETYDIRYKDPPGNAYEWAVPTGGNGLSFKPPKLVITFKPGPKTPIALPPPTDLAALAQKLQADGTGGKPTAVMPSPEEIRKFAKEIAVHQPAWMPDWQWQHVQDLRKIGGGVEFADGFQSGDPKLFDKAMQSILRTVPRYFKGWTIQDDLLMWNLYGQILPGPVKDHIKDYWTAWLMPERLTKDLIHPMAKEQLAYWQRTHDWQGSAAFFRAGFNYVISTMNFNHTAAMGALLGGTIIGSENAMADGRHGLEYLPLRFHAWADGTTQESIDHYYFAITLSGQKMFADFGPTPLDRLMGQAVLAKSIDELTSLYHPGLRHFISTSERTGMSFLFVTQGGLEHVMHTLSRQGSLHDVDNPDLHGMRLFDKNNAPAGRIALQTMAGPWAPEWVANMVDEKPLPYELTAASVVHGNFASTPLWKRAFLGHHYGMASIDIARSGSVPVLVQWRRTAEPVSSLQQLGTLLVRYGNNTTRLLTESAGYVDFQGGNLATVQHRNKMIVLSSPLDLRDRSDNLHKLDPAAITNMQTTIGLFNFESNATWKLYIDEQPVTALPAAVKAGQRITLKDGVSYLGFIPLPSTDLGRTAEVVISADAPEETLMDGAGKVKPALVINQYNRKADSSLAQAKADLAAVDRAYGGFVIEVSDATEYADFTAFQQHMREALLKTQWDSRTNALQVGYTSGTDSFDLAFRPEYQVYAVDAVPTDQCFPVRKVNGQWPYLPPRIDRDSTLTQQGSTGRLEKNGATLYSEPGHMTYLQTEPVSGTYAGFNPLPDLTFWALNLPGGVSVKADGRVGLLRVAVCPRENKVWFDYGLKPEQQGAGMATALLVFGMKAAPAVECNGKPRAGKPVAVTIDGQAAWAIPLLENAALPAANVLETRCRSAQAARAVLGEVLKGKVFFQDWLVVGPFANANFPETLWTGEAVAFPPEQKVDLNAIYTGIGPQETADFGKLLMQTQTVVTAAIRWKRLLAPDQPPFAEGPADLGPHMNPNKCITAYAYTTITSDRQRPATLYLGSDQRLTVWVNQRQVYDRHDYRLAAPDQDQVPVRLEQGENTVLLKLANGYEGCQFYFRVGDENGLPITDGLRYGAHQGKIPK